MKDTKISKQMAYLLRHDPSGMDISREGFVKLSELLARLQDRWPNLEKEDIQEIVEEDSKGRYELQGERIRALYGHSIDVDPTLNETEANTLYHGTTPEAAENILEEGLKPKGRQKVHLSKNVGDAVQVGKRRTDNPTILEIDVEKAKKDDVNIREASEKVYVAEEIPAEFISVTS